MAVVLFGFCFWGETARYLAEKTARFLDKRRGLRHIAGMGKPMPTADVLNLLLSYDPTSGKLYWRDRPPAFCNGETERQRAVSARKWNATYSGKEAFTHRNDRGYLVGSLFRTQWKAHRIIWKMVYDEEPDVIDHINMVRDDNRIWNLRSVTHAENCAHFTGPPRRLAA